MPPDSDERFGDPVYSAHTFDQAGLDIRFARAARHSRFVRFLRVSIPAIVGAALIGIILLSLFNPFRVTSAILTDTDNLVVSGTKITMESPHMTGFSADQRPYEIWGKTAVQDTGDPDNLDLTEPRGKMLLEDGSTMTVESRTGKFNNKTQILDLYTEVFAQTTTGYEVRLNHAQADLNAGSISSDDGVHVNFEGGRVKGDRVNLTNRGEVIRFDGNVVMDLDHVEMPQAKADAEAEAAEPKPVPAPAAAERSAETPRVSAGKPRSLISNQVNPK